jgi:two-component system NtrC family sensor kinase
VTTYSLFIYEKAIDNELTQRLEGNAREVEAIFSDFQDGLKESRDRYLKSSPLNSFLATADTAGLKTTLLRLAQTDFATSVTVFNKDGRLLSSYFRSENSELKEFNPSPNSVLFLSEQNQERMKDINELRFIEFGQNKMSLIQFSKFNSRSGRHLGYLEQVIEVDSFFIKNLQKRMNLEFVFFRSGGIPILASHEDFFVYKKDFYTDLIKAKSESFFDLNIRGVPHGFIVYPLTWGQSDVFLALGASKVEALSVLKNINYAFFSVVGVVILLLIVTIILASAKIIKPITDLVEAIDELQNLDRPIEIPVRSETEIGLLTESLNQMSRNVSMARSDLRRKISELEEINGELRETQARLVHSSKMVSLGQLVAGVAHELNNPIGFIYSNMAHLKDYTHKLLKMIDAAPSSVELERLKSEYDLDYIRADMPKLISSCEDGARRTRDIVIGLRNFSRLEEAMLKEIDFNEAIDNTLQLLTGEIKNRIQIHKDYSNLPPVLCYASQINQVFMNILTNAAQAIEGQGNIWITSRKVTQLGHDMVEVSFQDSGKGMTAEVMEKIFDPFFSTKGVGQGTGLGLSISYGIIQSHGGEIEVKSQPGIGTEFIVRVPLRPPDQVSKR